MNALATPSDAPKSLNEEAIFSSVTKRYGETRRSLAQASQTAQHAHARAVTAVLLMEITPKSDWGKVERLLNCSPSFMERNRELMSAESPDG